jgi:hypothetical protein
MTLMMLLLIVDSVDGYCVVDSFIFVADDFDVINFEFFDDINNVFHDDADDIDVFAMLLMLFW